MIGQFKGRQKTNVYGWVSDLAVARSGFNQIVYHCDLDFFSRIIVSGAYRLYCLMYFGMWMHLEMAECLILFWGHCDLEVDPVPVSGIIVYGGYLLHVVLQSS